MSVSLYIYIFRRPCDPFVSAIDQSVPWHDNAWYWSVNNLCIWWYRMTNTTPNFKILTIECTKNVHDNFHLTAEKMCGQCKSLYKFLKRQCDPFVSAIDHSAPWHDNAWYWSVNNPCIWWYRMVNTILFTWCWLSNILTTYIYILSIHYNDTPIYTCWAIYYIIPVVNDRLYKPIKEKHGILDILSANLFC